MGCERTNIVKEGFLVVISSSRDRTEISEAGSSIVRKVDSLKDMLGLKGIGHPSENIAGCVTVKSGRQMVLEV